MGMQVGKSGGVKNDINVTPLIDVVLVLLIIFLVTMPIMMRTITLEVPRKLDDRTEEPPNTKSITILVKADSSVEIDNSERVVTCAVIEVGTQLQPLLEGKTDKLVFVDFEDPVTWDTVVIVMDQVRSVAKDKEHNEVKVALKIRDAAAAAAPE